MEGAAPQMLAWELVVEAEALRKQGWTISAIARHLGVTRSTVRRYLSGEQTPGVRASSVPDRFAEYVEYCRLRLAADPHLWATTLFNQLDHSWLERFLEHRIADKRVLRLIRKWLSAGVIEEGQWSENVEGAPQGASVSPLLANVYLHYVFDLWARWWRNRFAGGDVVIVRFADDFTVGFEHQEDAQRFWADLHERFAKFGLELHPDKTRLIEFGRLVAWRRKARGLGKPETFDFLGFTHFCGFTKRGRFWLRRITIRKRMQAKLREVNDQLKRRRHQPIPEQGKWLRSVVTGHLAYYAVPGNTDAVEAFRTQVSRHWFKALRRRSQRARLNWKQMDRLTTKWLPPARVWHPFPDARFDARIQGRSPVR